MPRPRTNTHEITPAAARMFELRKERGWNQVELAKHLKTHLSNVARIETGVHKPSLDMIEKMMDLFNVTADELIRPPRKLSAKEVELNDLMVDIRKLDEKQRASVRVLVDAHKKKLWTRVLISDRIIEDAPGIMNE